MRHLSIKAANQCGRLNIGDSGCAKAMCAKASRPTNTKLKRPSGNGTVPNRLRMEYMFILNNGSRYLPFLCPQKDVISVGPKWTCAS